MKTAPARTDTIQTVTPAYLRRDDSARYLGISTRTLADWMKKGIISYSKPCRKVTLFAIRDLDKAVARFRVDAVV